MTTDTAQKITTSPMYQPLRDSAAEYAATTDAPTVAGFRAWQGASVMTDEAITVLLDQAATAPAKTFEVGSEYSCRSACSYDTIWTFTVTKRTEKFITIVEANGDTHRVGVKLDSEGHEYASPFGTYSMSPIIRAASAAA